MNELRDLIHNSNLTKTQQMIARYILDNHSDACFMTSTEIAEKLGCEIYMYDNLGHAAHEEAKDFNKRVMEFLDK